MVRYRHDLESIGEGTILECDLTIIGGRAGTGVGVSVGSRCHVYAGTRLVVDHIYSGSGITIGDDVAINYAGYIDGSGGVSIGDDTIIGPGLVILSSSHGIDDSAVKIREAAKSFKPVTVGNDVWIGANVTILMGVSVGDGAVLGAGSVVTSSVDARTVVAGVPARTIRTRE
jgi:acetyltransferase-like isoleucine patch superfamily enzyme